VMRELVFLTFIALVYSQAWFNGINVPWNSFGYDIGAGAYDFNWFTTFFQDCQTNHINSARFWLHCDGRASPQWASDGHVTGLSATFLNELTNLTTLAKSYNVVLLITFWSFDMCKQETSNGFHPDLISDATKTQSYIDNALKPILKALSGFENVVYEVINEPEWCIQETPGNTPTQVPLVQMQRFVGMIAAAIHQNSPQKVTLGSSALKWNSDKVPPAVGNWWSDASIGKGFPGGKLDFYQFHFYDWCYNPDWGFDPCRVPASYWQLDKPTVVGELPATGGSHYSPTDLLQCSFNDSYVGDMFWSYKVDFPWRNAITAWNSFYSNHANVASYAALVKWLKSL